VWGRAGQGEVGGGNSFDFLSRAKFDVVLRLAI
jgi:hypothetical protein